MRVLRDYEPPLDEPVNYYMIPELGVMIDSGIRPPLEGYDTIYITHWHWDHVLGLSRVRDKTICMNMATLDMLKTRKYSDRFLTVLRAGGIELNDAEFTMLRLMDERLRAAVAALDMNRVLPLSECPHVRDGTISYFECPGHSVDHVCYVIGDSIFVGDTLLPSRRTTILDFRRHRESIIKILGTAWARLYPGHGDPMNRDSATRAAKVYLVDRCNRVYRILKELAISGGKATLAELARRIYGVEPGLHAFVAVRTLIGYLAELEEQGVVRVDRRTSPWTIIFS